MTKYSAMVFRSRQAASPQGHHRRRAFTLVEMIAVMAVLAILAAVLLPAVTSLSKSSARRSAVTRTLSTLDQTRALALSKGGAYYLVFADQDAAWPEQYRCRSYAIYEEIYNTTANRYDRFPATPWTQLPTGIAFKPDTVATATTVATVFGGAKEEFYCAPVGKNMTLPCFKFNSLGGVDEPTDTNYAHVRLFEGFFNGAGQRVATNSAGVDGEEILDVSLVTGRAKREEQKQP